MSAMVEASAARSSAFMTASCSRTAGNEATGRPKARRYRAKDDASR